MLLDKGICEDVYEVCELSDLGLWRRPDIQRNNKRHLVFFAHGLSSDGDIMREVNHLGSRVSFLCPMESELHSNFQTAILGLDQYPLFDESATGDEMHNPTIQGLDGEMLVSAEAVLFGISITGTCERFHARSELPDVALYTGGSIRLADVLAKIPDVDAYAQLNIHICRPANGISIAYLPQVLLHPDNKSERIFKFAQ